EVKKNFAWGATGATSNPIIISDILKAGGYDQQIRDLADKGMDDDAIAWTLNDQLVKAAQQVFLPVWEKTAGNNGYVSFEVDPLLEDVTKLPPREQAVKRYVELGKKWAAGH